LCAIKEFNSHNQFKKIANPYLFEITDPNILGGKIFIFHDFKHPEYNIPIKKVRQLHLRKRD